MSDDAKLEAELAELRARRESLERARAEREAAEAKRAQVEALRLEVEKAEAVAKATEELGAGKFAVIDSPLGAVIVKRPNHMQYRKFINAKDVTSDDAEKLVLTCLVHPSRAAFEAIAEEYPAIPLEAAAAVMDLARGRAKDVSEKS